LFKGSRGEIKSQAADAALGMVREYLETKEKSGSSHAAARSEAKK
jgi:hypothetical protein